MRLFLVALAVSLAWAQDVVVVSGRVTDAVTGQAIEGATITLEQGSGREIQFTDSGGNYSFGEALAGTGRVQIQKDGYIPFQRSNPDESSVQIGADHVQQSFTLKPAASIRGKISGDGDKSGSGIIVTLLYEDFTGGVARFVPVTSTLPTGAGADASFAFAGLEPGRYIVSANTRPAGQLFVSEMICGAGGECSAVQSTNEAQADGYVTTYFPGTTQFADALPITVGWGDKRTVDFRIAKRPLFRASGETEASDPDRVVESYSGPLLSVLVDGERTQSNHSILLTVTRTDGGPAESGSARLIVIPGPFVLDGLAAGQYTAATAGLTGSVSFAITDHDVSGLRMVLGPPQKKLTADGAFRMAIAGAALPAVLSVNFAWPLPGESTPTRASENGHFALTAFPGVYSVLPVVPSGYAVTELR